MLFDSLDVVIVGSYPESDNLLKGGVQASIAGLSRALTKHELVATVTGWSIPNSGRNRPAARHGNIGGVSVTYLEAPWRFQLSAALNLPVVMRAIAAAGRAVVHVHGTGLLQVALLALMRIRKKPCVWTLHGLTEKEALQRYRERRSPANLARYLMYRCLERISIRVSRVILVDTPYVKATIRSVDKVVRVIPQGISTADFDAPGATARDASLILSVGMLTPRKGHHLTIQAFARVRAALPTARLIIAGGLDDVNYYNSLLSCVHALGLSGCVEIRIDVERDELITLLQHAAVFALHSQEESQGIALCEALAAALPVVSTQVGGIPFVIANGRTGFLVEYGDIVGFGERLIMLLNDRELASRMASEAKLASKRFDWAIIADQVVAQYQAVLDEPERRGEWRKR